MEISETILLWRRRYGFTQQELAEKLGVSTQSISSWETGKTTPPSFIRAALLHIEAGLCKKS